MPSLPIPAFGAIVLGFLALRVFLRGEQRLLPVFLVVCAMQSLMMALVWGYGVTALRPVLPLGAAAIPPLAWVTFRAALFGPLTRSELAPHTAIPVFVLFCLTFAPVTVDAVVALIFAGYGIAILWQLARTVDLPLARIDAGGLTKVLWRGLGWALIGSAMADVLISIAFAVGHPEAAALLIGMFSSATLLVLGVLSATQAASGEAEPTATAQVPDDDPIATEAEDAEIMASLDLLLQRGRLHLDHGLTLARLARRLRLPEKRLSAAVNRATAANVSRYINRWRIDHACARIAAGDSITAAMLDSGFNTKSNFNREFLRVTGLPPSQWRSAPPALVPPEG